MFGRKKGNRKGNEKQINKRSARKYGQTRLKHSTMGKNSCRLAIIALCLLVVSIMIAFMMRGKTLGFVGGMGILSMVLASLGIRAALKGFRERERNYITCKIGVAANIVMLLELIVIFFGGLFK